MDRLSRMRGPLFALASAALLLGGASTGRAQTAGPAALPHAGMLLGAYVDYPGLLLLPPRSYGLLQEAADEAGDGRMVAYRQFEASLRLRTTGVARLSGSSEQTKAAKRKILSDIGQRLEELPGGEILLYGRELWERVQDTTNLDLEGYRLRLQVDDAVHGKLALKVQKRLR